MLSAIMIALSSALVVTVAPSQSHQHKNSIYGVVLDAAGNCYVAFNTHGPITFTGVGVFPAHPDGSGGIAKFGPDGTVEWVRIIPASASSGLRAIAIDASANVYVTGWLRHTPPGDQFETGVLLAKYDSSGND
ncbi:MAG: hypothetical protein HW389_796, partial [Bacteroidetes bacterium]|nr:hypothetical protein [Bacteroidota bacterium]